MSLDVQVILRASRLMQEHPRYRWGQALYNALHDLAPELAREINGGECDPFFASKNDDPNIVAFFDWLKTISA